MPTNPSHSGSSIGGSCSTGDGAAPVRPIVQIVDDDPDMARLMALWLAREGYRTQVHTGARDFLNAFGPDRCDCLVADYFLPEMTGLELHERLRSDGHHVPFVIVTGNGKVSAAVESLRHGACGFLEKPFEAAKLLDAVRNAVHRQLEWSAVQARLDSLSRRERDVLSLVAAGELTKQIARRLDISPRTVEVHRSHIMKKMGMHSVAQLVHTLTKHALEDSP